MRSLKASLRNIRRTPFQTVAAIMVLTLTFFVTTVFVLVALGTQKVLTHFETQPQVIAYLKDGTPQEKIDALASELKNTGKVEMVRFVSKEEALKIYKESVGNDPLLLGTVTNLSLVTADVLPASLEISAYKVEDFDQIVEVLKRSEIVDVNAAGEKDIDFPRSVVEELTAWTRGIRLAGMVLIAALSLSSIITIVIILSMKIAGHKAEIATMKLLGAGKGFIIMPYILESLFYTITGTLFGWMLAFIALLYSTPFLVPRLSGIVPLPVDYLTMLMILGGLLVGAIVLGWISGLLAIGRFVRRK